MSKVHHDHKTAKPHAPKGAVKPSAAAPQINKLPSPFGTPPGGVPPPKPYPAPGTSTTPPAFDPPPAGEQGRELTGSEVADAAAAHLEKKATPKVTCPTCGGAGTVAQGNGRTRCTVCDGAGEIART